jgi:hypothetical protein
MHNMQTTSNQVISIFTKKITEAYEDIRDGIVSGSCIDHANYNYRVGLVQGLRLTLEFLEDAKAIANGEKKA